MSAARPSVVETIKAEPGAWIARAVVLALGVFVLGGGLSYRVFDSKGYVAAGFIPFAAGLIILLATIYEAVAALLKRPAADDEPEVDAMVEAGLVDVEDASDALDVFGRAKDQRGKAVALIFGMMALAAGLSYVIGLLLSVALLVFALLFVVERRKLWVALLGGVLVFLFGYVVFGLLLKVPLPRGMLGLI